MSNTPMLAGKVVIVTGAGGGIGRDIALAMAREGAQGRRQRHRRLGRRRRHRTPARRSRGRRDPGRWAARPWPTPTACRSPRAAARIVATALDTFGRIDVVVNNAGILRDRFFHKMSVEEWDAVIKVHLYGSFYVSRAAATHFKEQDSRAATCT